MSKVSKLRVSGRVGRNFAAQIFSQVATLAIQLGTIPLLIWAWGIETYGVWLLLTAIPTFLTLSDFGFTFVAKNTMSMQVAKKDVDGAVETFQSIFALLLAICAAIMLVAAILIWTLPFDRLFDLGPASIEAARVVLSAQIAAVLLYQGFLLLCAGLRADGQPATETMFGATSRLAEAGAICVAAILGADIALAALAGLGARVVALGALLVHTRRRIAWLPIGLSRAKAARLRALLWPSLSYMLVPLANALLIQGPVVVLGAVSGPTTVALFSVTRTVTRLGMAGANMLNFTFTPEYSYAFGRADEGAFRHHTRLHLILLGAGIVAFAGTMALLSPLAIDRLSHGAVQALPSLTAIMAISVALEMLWSGLFTPLAAVNLHRASAAAFAALAVLAVGVCWLTPDIFSLALGVLAVHAAMLLVSARAAYRLMGEAANWPAAALVRPAT